MTTPIEINAACFVTPPVPGLVWHLDNVRHRPPVHGHPAADTVTYTAVATYTGRSEFYTGLKAGVQVEVQAERFIPETGPRDEHTWHYVAARVEGGAWLSIHEPTAVLSPPTPTTKEN